MDPERQTALQLYIAARIDMQDWKAAFVRAESLLRGCAQAEATK